MSKSHQIPMNLRHPVSFDLSDFIVSSSNSVAFQFLNAFPESCSHFGALVGPSGSGKSHLLHGWSRESGALAIAPDTDVSDLKADCFYIIDDINQIDKQDNFSFSDDYLFHLFNWTKEIKAKLIVTADAAPAQWGRKLPDLISRLATAQVAKIEEPDDELLLVILVKLFSDRQLQVNINVLNYAVNQMERSFSAALRLVELVDKTALAEKRKITKALLRSCIELM